MNRIRVEAADLLACLASQPKFFDFTMTAPGCWSSAARTLARDVWREACAYDHDWREQYAEAEARLREVTRG